MCNYNRHRRTGFERFTRDGPVPPQPDAITEMTAMAIISFFIKHTPFKIFFVLLQLSLI